jgi:outer membrane protein OmpA-like peptidoglycan-associated protein/ABC-type nitrate/sulfonate/bicarbonate transport system substrate-binding protein
MSGHLKTFIAILLLGTIAILGYRFALPHLEDAFQRATSDAAATRGKVRIGVDNWVGYFPLCSPEMTRRMRAEGYALRCEDDQADVPKRLERLAEGDFDFAVSTIDAYVLNGAALDFPAAIIAVIDESQGGDAIIARRSVVPDLDALKRKPDVRIAYTPASPSEHLLKSIVAHFDLPQGRQRESAWRVEARGASDAREKLERGDVDVAVLWEPEVSKALGDAAYVKLIGTADTEKLIVDVLLASRRTVQERPESAATLLKQYFETLRAYGDSPAKLREDVARSSGLPAAQVDAMLAGVRWATLNDNGALWFGITPSGLPEQEGLVNAITGAVGVLVAAGDFAHNPLPDQDPYRVTNRQFVANLYLGQADASAARSFADDGLTKRFPELDDAGWQRLTEVGTLKIETIAFARGTATLGDESRDTLNGIVARLSHYPNYRLVVKGHTGLGGDESANVQLSLRRAEAVVDYLVGTFHMDADRIRALGFGSAQPLPRLPDESDRAYAYRLPRVEFALVSERF